VLIVRICGRVFWLALVVLVLAVFSSPAAGLATPSEFREVVEIRGEPSDSGSVTSWDAFNFPGFWYDLDEGVEGEHLTITPGGGRSLGQDDIVYTTSRRLVMFEVTENTGKLVENGLDCSTGKPVKVRGSGGGCYAVFGFFGEPYVAIDGNAKKMGKLVIEQEEGAQEKKSLRDGEVWDLGGGYTLVVNGVDANADPKLVWFTLSYKGKFLDDAVVGQGDVYVYIEDNIAGASEVPLFVTLVDKVFEGSHGGLAQFRYTWAVDRAARELRTSDRFGVFEVKEVNDTTITLKNERSVELTKDSNVLLAEDLYLRVADNNTIRFYPAMLKKTPGVYKVRGEPFDEKKPNFPKSGSNSSFSWDAFNFPGFWYDLDDALTGENLTFKGGSLTSSRRTIREGELTYNTTRQLVRFEINENALVKSANGTLISATVEDALDCATGNKVDEGDCYAKIGWLGQPYVALGGDARKLSKLIIEMEETSAEKKTIALGQVWDIGGGWTLGVKSLDTNSQPRQAWIILAYKGRAVDSSIIQEGEVYTYVADSIAGESDVPVFATFLERVFGGIETEIAQFRYTWAISLDVTEVETGDTFGIFKVDTASNTGINLSNQASLELTPDSEQEVAGDIYFKIADNTSVLRFYPYVPRTVRGETGTQETIPTEEMPTEEPLETPPPTEEPPLETPAPTPTPTPTPSPTPSPTPTPTLRPTPTPEITVGYALKLAWNRQMEKIKNTLPPEIGELLETQTLSGFLAGFAVAAIITLFYLLLRKG